MISLENNLSQLWISQDNEFNIIIIYMQIKNLLTLSQMTIFLVILASSFCIQILDNIPIVFKIDGNVSYTPTSGITQIPGYKIKVGYEKNTWIGVKFMQKTQNSNYDILVIERSTKQVGGMYQTNVADYFVSSGRQQKLISDSINNMDKHVTTYSQGNYFFVDIYRTKGNTQGEDWEGGDFVQICFLTSEKNFNINQWTNLNESCYGYSVSEDYVSTYRGKKIADMSIDGTNSATYGGIQGPPLALNLFWYYRKSSLSSSDVLIRLGGEIDPQIVGYDYHKCGSGDYFGLSKNQLTPDKTWSGYDDGQCNIENTASSTHISFAKNVFTYDDFDGTIYNETEVCVYVGSKQSCQTLAFENLYPIMDVQSSFKIFEDLLTNVTNMLLGILCLMTILQI